MADNIRVNGTITTWMQLVSTHGLMDVVILESIEMIKNTATVFISGPMGASI